MFIHLAFKQFVKLQFAYLVFFFNLLSHDKVVVIVYILFYKFSFMEND